MSQTETKADSNHFFRPASRLGRLDIARGMALIAMAIYHFGWDLEFFGYLQQGSASQGWWRIFARCIASSFLFLVGFSLVLAHGRAIRWHAFFKRLAQIIAAAATISLLTWFFVPQGFIFFGILHQIALASLLGLLFLHLPFWILLPLAALIITAPHFFTADFFNHPAFWWVGLSSITPVSNDYVPLFPWFGAVLTGIAAAQILQKTGLITLLQGGIRPLWLQRALTFIGRHSLVFYLIHQPVLMGLLFVFSQAFPPSPAMLAANFNAQCVAQCSLDNEAQFCQAYCGCVIKNIEDARLTHLFSSKSATNQEREKLGGFSAQCVDEIYKGQPVP
ncbi:DUF1624 domain-containing protein [Pseudochrobactrum sp. HB0163]|uniref:DUF1624 domain-containing protein n=1 Tax=Pseudochrobactrum sp. HB0163 TaxID=3450708 RepID=UPI003F6E4250